MQYALSLLITLFLAASPAPALAKEPAWFLLSREDGCVGLDTLARHERLEKTPATPEEFADMMRSRGERVSLGLPDGFPPEFAGKAVIVRVRENMSPVFVREEFCERIDK